jgi:hypothetical protein
MGLPNPVARACWASRKAAQPNLHFKNPLGPRRRFAKQQVGLSPRLLLAKPNAVASLAGLANTALPAASIGRTAPRIAITMRA